MFIYGVVLLYNNITFTNYGGSIMKIGYLMTIFAMISLLFAVGAQAFQIGNVDTTASNFDEDESTYVPSSFVLQNVTAGSLSCSFNSNFLNTKDEKNSIDFNFTNNNRNSDKKDGLYTIATSTASYTVNVNARIPENLNAVIESNLNEEYSLASISLL